METLQTGTLINGQLYLRPRTFKADLDGAIFAYDYCAWRAYVMTFDHPQVHRCHLQYSTMSYTNIMGLIYMTWSVMKSRLWYPA